MLAVGDQELFKPGPGLDAIPGGITAEHLQPEQPTPMAPVTTAAAPELIAPQPSSVVAPVPQISNFNATPVSDRLPGQGLGLPAPTAPAQPPTGAGTYPDLFNQPITPILDQVDPNETVQGQLVSLLDRGNPLMVKAREDAKRMAAGRGLQNTTMAAQAGEQALFASALPVAQQDAAQAAQVSSANTQAQNAFRMSQQQFAQNMELAKQKFGFDASLSAQDAYQQLVNLAQQGDQQAELALINFGFQRDLTVLQGQIARDQANLDFANRLVELGTQGDIQSRLQMEQFGFNTQLSAQENLERLQQLAAQGDINAMLQLQQFNFQSLLSSQEHGQTIGLEDRRFQNGQNMLMLEFAQRGVLSSQEAQQQLEYLNQQHLNTLAQIQAQVSAQISGDAAAAGRAMQNNYLLAVANRQQQTSQEVATIYQTQGLSAAQQNAAVTNAYARLQQDLLVLRTYYQQSPLWDPNFGTPSTPGVPGPAPGPMPGPIPGPGGVPPGTVPVSPGPIDRMYDIAGAILGRPMP